MSAGLALRDDDSLIIGCRGTLARFDVHSAVLTPCADLPHHHPNERTNDLCFDASGCLWVTTMHVGGEQPLGRLLRLGRDGEWMTILEGAPVLNGPAFDATGTVGYVCDTTRRCVLRFPVPAVESTTCAAPEPFITLAETDGFPDGITVDATGNVWLAHYAGGRVTCFAADGTVRQVLTMPVRNVTSVAIGAGALYVTTAHDPSDGKRVPGGTLFTVPIEGLEPARP